MESKRIMAQAAAQLFSFASAYNRFISHGQYAEALETCNAMLTIAAHLERCWNVQACWNTTDNTADAMIKIVSVRQGYQTITKEVK